MGEWWHVAVWACVGGAAVSLLLRGARRLLPPGVRTADAPVLILAAIDALGEPTGYEIARHVEAQTGRMLGIGTEYLVLSRLTKAGVLERVDCSSVVPPGEHGRIRWRRARA